MVGVVGGATVVGGARARKVTLDSFIPFFFRSSFSTYD